MAGRCHAQAADRHERRRHLRLRAGPRRCVPLHPPGAGLCRLPSHDDDRRRHRPRARPADPYRAWRAGLDVSARAGAGRRADTGPGRRRRGLSRDRRPLAYLPARREWSYPRLVPGEGRDVSTIAKGGKALYGAPLGILMLEARFPRIPGDMGNATTWPFPVLYRIVKGATPESVVLKGAAGLLPNFLEAAAELVRHGAEAITTNCGFLSLFQKELAAHVKVPVATSSLLQVPWVQATLPPGKRVGVVTVSASSLTPKHLEAAGVPPDTPFVGTEKGREFFRVLILGEKDDMDVAKAQQDIIDAGRSLVATHPDIGAIVLECTNMPPYAAALREALSVPVYDIYSMISWFHAGLRPRRFTTG